MTIETYIVIKKKPDIPASGLMTFIKADKIRWHYIKMMNVCYIPHEHPSIYVGKPLGKVDDILVGTTKWDFVTTEEELSGVIIEDDELNIHATMGNCMLPMGIGDRKEYLRKMFIRYDTDTKEIISYGEKVTEKMINLFKKKIINGE